MLKSFLIIINLHIFVYASQILLVISDDMSTHKAQLQLFKNGKKVGNTIDVNIGKNGLGLGLSEIPFKIKTNVYKKEGDKKAPLGIYKLTSVFGYEKKLDVKMPYIYTSDDLICVDDSNSPHYNKIINMPINKPSSFEKMKRDDEQYKLGVVVQYNKAQIKNGGSCIFIHVQKELNASTAGCTSMAYKDLKKIVNWLDIKENPVIIQLSKRYLKDVKKLYPELSLD